MSRPKCCLIYTSRLKARVFPGQSRSLFEHITCPTLTLNLQQKLRGRVNFHSSTVYCESRGTAVAGYSRLPSRLNFAPYRSAPSPSQSRLKQGIPVRNARNQSLVASMAVGSVTKGLEPAALWTFFEEITKIPRPSKSEERCRTLTAFCPIDLQNIVMLSGCDFVEEFVCKSFVRVESPP
jgi:hypothetical protein